MILVSTLYRDLLEINENPLEVLSTIPGIVKWIINAVYYYICIFYQSGIIEQGIGMQR